MDKLRAAAQYLATALTALEMSGRVWVDSHISEPTNLRNGQFPGASILSNSPKSRPNQQVFAYFYHTYSVLVRQLFSERPLGNRQYSFFPIRFVETARIPP